MTKPCFTHILGLAAGALILVLASGCSALKTAATPPPAFYALDQVNTASRTTNALSPTAPTLIVSPPYAAPGFDSPRILYTRTDHQLEYFAHSEWVDTPARMLAPLVVAAIENSGSFRAVLMTPSPALGELRLDSEILRLEQDFTSQPSQVRFTLRAVIVDNKTRQVLAWREFDERVVAADDPYSGVIAANRAVQNALEKLAEFCGRTAGKWRPAADQGNQK